MIGSCAPLAPSITCSGMVTDDPAWGFIKTAKFNQQGLNIRVLSGPSQDEVFNGRCVIESLEITGEYNGAEEYSLSLQGVSA